MRPRYSSQTALAGRLISGLARGSVLGLPTVLLLAAGARSPVPACYVLWAGAAFQSICGGLALRGKEGWNRDLGPSIVSLYLTGLIWFWFGDPLEDWLNHLAKSILVVAPLLVFAQLTLHASGAGALRRANRLAQRLAERQDWPTEPGACRGLPEVKAFRAALAYDASPALALLGHPRAEVRLAALAALEFRKEWRPGQVELVLQMAQRTKEPSVRAAAVMALGNIEDRLLIEMLAQFLHDPDREVRRAATDALLWESDRRWGWVRYAVRRILSDPLFANDGPLLPQGQLLPADAVKDLTAWCAEKGILSARAAQTLAGHYARAVAESADPVLIAHLRAIVRDHGSPAVLRLELCRLLHQQRELDTTLAEAILDPSNPAPLRLMAAETILDKQRDDLLRQPAVSSLRDLARLPNREIALAAADIVQHKLGVDLGLGVGQPLPPIHSRQAADIARRVVAWAVQFSEEEDLERSGPLLS